MDYLKVEVEEIQLSEQGDYHAIVRANRYRDIKRSIQAGSEVIELAEPTKRETPAVFTVPVPRRTHGRQRKERSIEHIENDAKRAVLRLCREIIEALETKPKTAR